MTVVCYRNIWWRESDFRIFSGACTLRFYGPMLEVWYFELTNKLGSLLLSDACWNYLLRCMIGSNVLACQCVTLRTVSCWILVGLLFGHHSVFHFFSLNSQGYICHHPCCSWAVQNMCSSSRKLLSLWFKSRKN